jgi:hypothetical protein
MPAHLRRPAPAAKVFNDEPDVSRDEQARDGHEGKRQEAKGKRQK